MVKKLFVLIVLTTITTLSGALAQTTFKVATYNMLRFPNNSNTTPGGTNADRLAAFQARHSNDAGIENCHRYKRLTQHTK